jgi:membrane fusion protein (multidrug efflux system)
MGGPPPALATPQVGVVTVKAQRLALTTELAGRTAPVQVADVRPQVGGIVEARKFTEGSEVHAGDLLFQLAPASYRASFDSAQAALDKAQASLVTTKLKAERYAELSSIKAVSQQDADDSKAMLAQGLADVASAKAALETSRINLDYTRVISPITGRIGRSSVTAGALVTANQSTALATVQQLDPIYVDVTQSSVALLQLRRQLASGQLASAGTDAARVTLVLEDGSHYALPGKLKFSEVSVDQNSGSIVLRAEFPNPKGELLPGMYVRAVLEQGVNDSAILVPQAAVTRDSTGKATAFVVGIDGRIQLHALTVDRAVGDQWLVTDGLKVGDTLVVDGVQRIRAGQVVQVLPHEAGPTAPVATATVALR